MSIESTSTVIPPNPYNTDYYCAWEGKPNRWNDYKPERDIPCAKAIAEAAGLNEGDTVLDFGCGIGAMTAAFNAAGYPTIGVDTSPDAINNAIPEARGRVLHLGDDLPLSQFQNDMSDLVYLGDVAEHLPEDVDNGGLDEIVGALSCIGKRIVARIPTTNLDGSFIHPPYDKDPTHVTRLTRDLWLGRFACGIARELDDISELIDREYKVNGTLCLLLEETNLALRAAQKAQRARAITPLWRQVLGLSLTPFSVDFDSLYQPLADCC